MQKALCSQCGKRFAQHFDPPRCRGCVTGRPMPAVRECEDFSEAEIERRYQRALAEIKARHRAQPSREYV
jgi:hypothetical protein